MNSRIISYLIYLTFLVPIAAWCFLIILAPYLAETGNEYISDMIYFVFSFNCHQRPERSLFLFDHKLSVCSRCAAIYFGVLLSTILYPIFKRIDNKETPSKWLLILSLVPMGLDGMTQLTGLRESTNLLRIITGGLFGMVIPLYILPAYTEIVYEFIGVVKGKCRGKQCKK